ncbi:MAG: hypothetical protein AAF221_07885 [Pseudomonadota bacterium]
MSNQKAYDTHANEEDYKQFVGAPGSEEAAEKQATANFLMRNKRPNTEAEIESKRSEINETKDQQRKIDRKLRHTNPYQICDEADPAASKNPLETVFGLVGFGVLSIALVVVPGIATMLIIQAEKIALVADKPVFGLVFGVSALAGVLASIQFRSLLRSDADRLSYDRWAIKLTVGVFLVWAAVMSLAAYPIIIPTGAVEPISQPDIIIFDAVEDVSGIHIQPPMMLLFLITALLDLVAAPTLHSFALNRLTPRPVKRIIEDAEFKYLEACKDQKGAELEALYTDLTQLISDHEAFEAALQTSVENALSALNRLEARVEAAQNAAKIQALYAPNIHPQRNDTAKTNGFHA